jgi:hypothetical protein
LVLLRVCRVQLLLSSTDTPCELEVDHAYASCHYFSMHFNPFTCNSTGATHSAVTIPHPRLPETSSCSSSSPRPRPKRRLTLTKIQNYAHPEPSAPGWNTSTYLFLAPFFAAALIGLLLGGLDNRSSSEAAVGGLEPPDGGGGGPPDEAGLILADTGEDPGGPGGPERPGGPFSDIVDVVVVVIGVIPSARLDFMRRIPPSAVSANPVGAVDERMALPGLGPGPRPEGGGGGAPTLRESWEGGGVADIARAACSAFAARDGEAV